MDVITGDLPSFSLDSSVSSGCTNAFPSRVDDMHICGKDEFIDGPGKDRSNILGNAGPIYIRTNQATGKVTAATGVMRCVLNVMFVFSFTSIIATEIPYLLQAKNRKFAILIGFFNLVQQV